jgi:hypothetical protein
LGGWRGERERVERCSSSITFSRGCRQWGVTIKGPHASCRWFGTIVDDIASRVAYGGTVFGERDRAVEIVGKGGDRLEGVVKVGILEDVDAVVVGAQGSGRSGHGGNDGIVGKEHRHGLMW